MRAILLTLERWGALARKNDEHKGGRGAAITISCTGTDDGKDEKEAEGFRTEVLFQKDPDKLRPANTIPPSQPELNWLAVPGVVRRFKVRPLPSILAVCVQQTAPSVVEPFAAGKLGNQAHTVSNCVHSLGRSTGGVRPGAHRRWRRSRRQRSVLTHWQQFATKLGVRGGSRRRGRVCGGIRGVPGEGFVAKSG